MKSREGAGECAADGADLTFAIGAGEKDDTFLRERLAKQEKWAERRLRLYLRLVGGRDGSDVDHYSEKR